MSEVLNKNFQKVFTTKSDFEKPQGQEKKLNVRHHEKQRREKEDN